jgi:NAD(P)H dehydrogenase (quinone)
MKTLIVYAHPYDGGFCHAMLKSTIVSIEKAGGEVDLIDLNKDKFNPVMDEKDLVGFIKHEMVDPQSIDYVNRLKAADQLVLIFPIWWELMPAIMKGFIDKVFFPGSAYEYKKSGRGMYSLFDNLKATTVISTMNTPKLIYKCIYGNAVQKALMKGTFKKLGFKKVKWFNVSMIKWSTEKKRNKWLAQLDKRFSKKIG